MAITRITALTAITGANLAAGDQFVVVDVSDTSMDPTGTTKKIAKSEVDSLYSPASTATGLSDHLADTTDAHDASAISYAGGTGMSATDVEAAIDELATEKANAADYLPLAAAGASVENIGAVEANVNTVATTGSTETLDTSVYQVHDCTMDQNCTFTFSNPAPSGKCSSFVLILRGAFTPTLPASVDWSAGAAPTYTTPSMYTFTTVDAGTTWLGAQAGRAFA